MIPFLWVRRVLSLAGSRLTGLAHIAACAAGTTLHCDALAVVVVLGTGVRNGVASRLEKHSGGGGDEEEEFFHTLGHRCHGRECA